jgi:aminopeptidase N
MTNDFNPIVRRTYNDPNEMFNYLVYPKAGWLLHTLRCELGEDLFRRCIKTYLERFQYKNVSTEDLRAVIEELSGRSYDQFFDQWFYHGHFPELQVNYSWDEPNHLAKISIRQTQPVGPNVALFNFPLTVRFKSKTNDDRLIHVSKTDEDFYFPLPAAPDLVRLDPDYTLLAKVSFSIPNPMLYSQLDAKDDVVGRLLAVEELSHRHDREAVTHLKDTLNNDPFYGVRVDAAKALRSIHSDEALDALLASTKQDDARVRLQVVTAIGGFYDPRAADAARQTLSNEKNPAILIAAIRSLGGYTKSEVHDTLLKYLNSESYRNELADAAVSAIRSQDDPVYIAPLLDNFSKRELAFTSRGFAQGLDTLAWLARNQDNKDAVREFLVARVNHKKKSVQVATMRALGTLGDPKAIPVLETFAMAAKESPARAAAEQAVTTLRAGRKPIDDFKNLREEVLALQKANRDLHHELDDLKKKFEAKLTAPAPGSPTSRPKSKQSKS